MSEFGDRLARLAQVLGVEQRELAKQGGITQETFAKYRSGAAFPRFEALLRWTKELGLNANWLLMGEGPMFMKDFVTAQTSPPLLDPITQRILTLERVLRDAGASDEDIVQAVKAAVRADTSPARDLGCVAGARGPVARKSDAESFNDAEKE